MIPAMPLELTSRVRLTSDDFVDASVDGELVFMNVLEFRFHSLRDTGLRVWQLLDGDDDWATVGAVVTALCEEFEVDADTCLKDVSVLLEELREVGLVELQGEASDAEPAAPRP